MNNKKGFTLIELLAVIVILGIILTVAIPQITQYINSSREKTMRTSAQVFIDAVRTYATENSKFPYKGKEKKYELKEIYETIGLDNDTKKSPYGGEWDLDKSYVILKLSTEYVDSYDVYLIDKKGNSIGPVSESDLGSAPVNNES